MCVIKPDRAIPFRQQQEHKDHMRTQHNGSINSNSAHALVRAWFHAARPSMVWGSMDVERSLVEFRTQQQFLRFRRQAHYVQYAM